MTAFPMIDGAALEHPATIATISAARTGVGFFYLRDRGVRLSPAISSRCIPKFQKEIFAESASFGNEAKFS